jgi:hypothetical protein
MARNLISVHDAITRAEGTANGLDALISLLVSAREGDMPKGHHLAELLNGLHVELVRHLESARDGLRESK